MPREREQCWRGGLDAAATGKRRLCRVQRASERGEAARRNPLVISPLWRSREAILVHHETSGPWLCMTHWQEDPLLSQVTCRVPVTTCGKSKAMS